MENNIKNISKKLSVRDLIITGVFSALIFIGVMLGGSPFAINPVLTFYMPIGSALLPGPIFLLLIAKVHKRGAISILGTILAIFFYLTGMHWGLYVGYFVMGLIADMFAGLKKYSSIKFNIVSYILFTLGATGTYIVFFVNRSSWIKFMTVKGADLEYIKTMQEASHWWILVVIILGTIIVALISALIGSKLLKKQFEKAGITK